MMTATDLLPRARRGAELLDRARPGWAKEIDLGCLDLAGCRWCVLGQIFGSFEAGVDWLDDEAKAGGLDDGNNGPVSFGFDIHEDDPSSAYELLADAWRTLIAARLTPETT